MTIFSSFSLFIRFFLFLLVYFGVFFFFFSSRRRHTRLTCDWSSDVCSSDLTLDVVQAEGELFMVMEYVAGESLARLLLVAREKGARPSARVGVAIVAGALRSEERRVGKEGRSRWAPDH